MNAERFRKIVEALEIDVPVLRAEELPGGGVRFYLYGGRSVDYAASGEQPAGLDGVAVEHVRRAPKSQQEQQPGSKKSAAHAGKRPPGGAEQRRGQ